MLEYSLTPRSRNKKPTVRQIQPMGLLGRLEAMRAPTIGKARKGTPINKSVRVNLVLTLPGTCGADLMRTYSATMAKNMATHNMDNDHASQEATRPLILLTPGPCSLTPFAYASGHDLTTLQHHHLPRVTRIKGRRADSNRWSDNSCVAEVCRSLQIRHIQAAFSSL